MDEAQVAAPGLGRLGLLRPDKLAVQTRSQAMLASQARMPLRIDARAARLRDEVVDVRLPLGRDAVRLAAVGRTALQPLAGARGYFDGPNGPRVLAADHEAHACALLTR